MPSNVTRSLGTSSGGTLSLIMIDILGKNLHQNLCQNTNGDSCNQSPYENEDDNDRCNPQMQMGIAISGIFGIVV
jgi:hypothetical protein